ncbi:MAG TPA: hypothetical protein VFR80_13680 [Pyrinomonadaceae bacterium]|nr:hypothetical protein [Pyrinomonadaceae bacterium]
MPTKVIQRLLERLDEAKRRFGSRDADLVAQTVASLGRQKFGDAESLLQFHELLLFVRAYPPSLDVLRQADALLKEFADRVATLRAEEADLSSFIHPESSGIAGTSVTDTFSYPIVRWLVTRQTPRVKLAWDWFEDENRLAQSWPRFMPMLEDDAAVEANIPFKDWLDLASGDQKDLVWLIQRFESLRVSEKERTELFDGQKLYVEWTPPYRATRTGMRLPVKKIFYHREPLIQRRDVSLERELSTPPPPLKKLSAKQGAALLEMARETSTVRYRELYGFTHGDARGVLQAELGRGVELFVFSLTPGRGLPLRAYHAAMIFKNGIPVGYFEGLSLFERMESGFNFYYSFREGETAWIYARTLNVFRHLLGVTAFSLDPYQIGHENEEGIESGAFWFYRKLGFRPTQSRIEMLTENEEQKIADRDSYRTSARTLRRLAAGTMIWEFDKARRGDWDRFQVRNIGFKLQRHMAAQFKGDPEKMRQRSLELVGRALGFSLRRWNNAQREALAELTVSLALIPDINRWTRAEKELLEQILRAKVNGDETSYLRLQQKHDRLRGAIIKLGS